MEASQIVIKDLRFVSPKEFNKARIKDVNFLDSYSFYILSSNARNDMGYSVFVPALVGDGAVVFVNLGWIDYEGIDNFIEAKPRLDEFTAYVRYAKPKGYFTPNNPEQDNKWFWVDIDSMARIIGYTNYREYYLEIISAVPSYSSPLPNQVNILLRNNHFSYVLTWFGLAFGLVIMYVLGSLRRV